MPPPVLSAVSSPVKVEAASAKVLVTNFFKLAENVSVPENDLVTLFCSEPVKFTSGTVINAGFNRSMPADALTELALVSVPVMAAVPV